MSLDNQLLITNNNVQVEFIKYKEDNDVNLDNKMLIIKQNIYCHSPLILSMPEIFIYLMLEIEGSFVSNHLIVPLLVGVTFLVNFNVQGNGSFSKQLSPFWFNLGVPGLKRKCKKKKN